MEFQAKVSKEPVAKHKNRGFVFCSRIHPAFLKTPALP
jgi:hypothetical protein